ncbi:arylmalonate decarboxylase [Paroceanicella profunda]|uniref:Arylmalonate decarboxylase n=1 Tax=Paroceanicella profunda TaxID=2579971 RepID=A0A5B8FW34_9RHOB|nr:aspartate/glutamate racemase family protein [Paroceanicella profunda]QDL92655.1 arylmalonate decarboxylase [Paroceanicella profunda]
MTQAPMIGMIVPPAADTVPPEGPAMYPDLRFAARGLGLEALTPEGYDSVIGRIGSLAADLAAAGADVVAVMGTSLTFYRGRAFNEALTRDVAVACGRPVVTMSTGIVEAIAATGARRIALATAYGETVNARLSAFLAEHGVETVALAALGIEDVRKVFDVTHDDLLALGRRAVAEAAAAGARPDALFISCGGLRTLPVCAELQAELGLPVVSSATAGVDAAVRRLPQAALPAGT